MYAVILAGGGGTRLHPLSRPERPKPFLPLLGERSLFQATVDRVSGLTSDITVVTDRRYSDLVADQAPSVGIVAEPLGRNTAAAIALAAIAIDRPPDDVMVVLPAGRGDGRPARRSDGGAGRCLPRRHPECRRSPSDGGVRDRRSPGHARDP